MSSVAFGVPLRQPNGAEDSGEGFAFSLFPEAISVVGLVAGVSALEQYLGLCAHESTNQWCYARRRQIV